MPGVQNENAVDERVDDVMFGIQKYGSMVATFFHASDENPIVPILAADFMSQLIAKLVEWNVLTKEQHTQLMLRVQEESRASRNNNDEVDPTEDLIARLGI